MIARPRNSVTRFFVPLIDVLILLFCIFLLMPFVSQADSGADGDAGEAADTPNREELPSDVEVLRKELADARAELKRLETKPGDLAERLSLKILEVELPTGKLITTLDGQRQEIASQKDAEEMIDRHVRLSGAREPLFLILLPKRGAPLQRDMENYRRWFGRVAYSFDEALAPNSARERP